MRSKMFRRKKSQRPKQSNSLITNAAANQSNPSPPLFRVRPRRRRGSDEQTYPEMATPPPQRFSTARSSPESINTTFRETPDERRVLIFRPSPSSSVHATPSRQQYSTPDRKGLHQPVLRQRMDFLNTYFTLTPSRSQARQQVPQSVVFEQIEALPPAVRHQDNSDDDNDESPKSVITQGQVGQCESENEDELNPECVIHSQCEDDQQNASQSTPTNSSHRVEHLTRLQQQDSLNSSSRSNAKHSQIICAMSPLSEQYARLRRVRRHYSETDADTVAWSMSITEREDSSVHFLAPLTDVEDMDSLQTIRLTPRIIPPHPTRATNTTPISQTPSKRVQSFDDIAFSPHIRAVRVASPHPNLFHYNAEGYNGNDEHDKQSSPSPIKKWLFAQPSKQQQKDKEKDKNKDKDKDKDKTFNFFGIKFRRQMS